MNKKQKKLGEKLIKLCFLFFIFVCITSAFSLPFEEDEKAGGSLCKGKKNDNLNEHGMELISFPEAEEPPLYPFIQKYLIHQERVPESQLRNFLRLGVKGAGVIFGSLAGIPYFEPGRQAGGKNEIIAWIVGSATAVAISGTGLWSYLNLLKSLDPHSPEEKDLMQKNKFPLLIHTSSHVLGLAAAVPTAYIAARFNTYKWLAVISYGLEYSLKTNGFLTFFTGVFPQKNKIKQPLLEELPLLAKNQTEIGSSLLEMSSLLIKHLSKKTIPSLIAMENGKRNELILLLHQKSNLTAEDYLKALLNIPSASLPFQETPDAWKEGRPRAAFVGILSISALMNVVHNFHCAYAAWKMLYDQPAFIIPMAVLSIAPTFVLELQATTKTGHALYDSAFYYMTGVSSPSLAQSLYPKLMKKTLPIACLSIAGVTAYVGRFMVLDILHDVFSHEYSLLFSVGGVLGPLLFTSYVNYCLVENLVLSYTRSYGEEHKKKFTLLIQDIEKLTHVISRAKPEKMEKFLANPNIQAPISVSNGKERAKKIPLKKTRRNPFRCGVM